MASLEPFCAVRYTGAAGPLSDLVAPPYDAVTSDERRLRSSRSPHNVLHLTLPESDDDAARLYRSWLATGILERDTQPAVWLLVEDFVGPDGVARERRGVVVSLAAEPYETRSVLPHERTHARIRDERLSLLQATRVQPEPILVLLDGPLALERPERAPEHEAEGSRLWRLDDVDLASLEARDVLIADGHHRYESAVALGEEQDGGARIMALAVSTHDPGLHVFPTHRVFSGRPELAAAGRGAPQESLEHALAALAAAPAERAVAVTYARDGIELIFGDEGQLDVELVDRHGLDGISYTPSTEVATAAVDTGEADIAFLLRAPRVEDVLALARRGERMPPKSTYFFPKPLSGLLFHPVEAGA